MTLSVFGRGSAVGSAVDTAEDGDATDADGLGTADRIETMLLPHDQLVTAKSDAMSSNLAGSDQSGASADCVWVGPGTVRKPDVDVGTGVVVAERRTLDDLFGALVDVEEESGVAVTRTLVIGRVGLDRKALSACAE